MTRIGILIHCRNMSTIAWEDLVFGRPDQGKLGDHATLAHVMLTLGKDEEVSCIAIGRGPSSRDGLDEGDYSKRYLLDNFNRWKEFQLLKPLLANLSEDELIKLRQAMEDIVVGVQIQNTLEEVTEAAKLFRDAQVDKVIQIAAASHAPRCLKEQSILRDRGIIKSGQLWQVIATDMSYDGTKPRDVCIIEPPHRFDQPLTYVRPGLSEVIAPYFSLKDGDKKAFIRVVNEFMTARSHLP